MSTVPRPWTRIESNPLAWHGARARGACPCSMLRLGCRPNYRAARESGSAVSASSLRRSGQCIESVAENLLGTVAEAADVACVRPGVFVLRRRPLSAAPRSSCDAGQLAGAAGTRVARVHQLKRHPSFSSIDDDQVPSAPHARHFTTRPPTRRYATPPKACRT
jgi:hypothetical protein